MNIEFSGSEIPSVVVRYFEVCREISNLGKLYSLDQIREDLHNELCDYYGVNKEATKHITNNLDKYNGDVVLFWFDIKEVKNE